jgi:hypothetical protein
MPDPKHTDWRGTLLHIRRAVSSNVLHDFARDDVCSGSFATEASGFSAS